MPTETGLSLFGILKQADPALVDPGVTAQLECLLDDVVVGKQEMIGAIDAVCDVAERIIGRLKEGVTAGGPGLLGDAVSNAVAAYPPTPAMKRFADSLSRQKGVKPPPGYKTSISICRKFLSEHAPKKTDGETAGKLDPKPVSPAQLLYAKKIAQGKGLIIPMKRRLTQTRCPRGLTQTKARSAVLAVVSPRTNRRDQLGIGRHHRRGLGSTNLTPMPRSRLPSQQVRLRVRHCGFLMATRTSP